MIRTAMPADPATAGSVPGQIQSAEASGVWLASVMALAMRAADVRAVPMPACMVAPDDQSPLGAGAWPRAFSRAV